MNRPLSTRGRRYRSRDSVRQSCSAGFVPGAFGLVGGTTNTPQRATPPWSSDGVGELPIVTVGGSHRKREFLAQGLGWETMSS